MEKNKLKSILISTDITIKQAMRKLNDTAQKILFVTNEHDRLIGTVSDGDIRRGVINGVDLKDNIRKIIHKKFIMVKLNTPMVKEHAKQLMIENKIEQIPVLDDSGKIIDVILWSDILLEKEQLHPKILYPNQVVIMAGGKGTRLDPFTKIFPKPLIPIGDKPIIEIIMGNFYQYGFHNFIYTLNYKKEYLKLFFKENNFPYAIDWIEEEDFLGTAGSISLLKDKIVDTFFVINCDSLLNIDFGQVLEWHREHKAMMTIIGCHNEVKIPFGVLNLSNGKVDKILEKPIQDIIINTGVYVMEPQLISYIPKGKHMDMNSLIDIIIKKEKVSVYPIYDGWVDMGQWEKYKDILKVKE